jgi:hypothetical protein
MVCVPFRPVSPDNVHETGASPRWTVWIPHVAAEAERVERTRKKTWSRTRSEVFVAYTPSSIGTEGIFRLPNRTCDGRTTRDGNRARRYSAIDG